MNPIVNFSPYGGQLIKENVLGITSGKINPENNVETVLGSDRDMFVYVPASGCPHAKQTQVLMVLRDENTKESAQKIIEELKLDELAENENFILVFPNPHKDGWNYTQDSSRDNDIQYLVRCFAALPKSKGKVAGFNGMIFHLATSSKSSAMAMTLAANSPLDAAAIMISEFPEEYNIPAAHNAEQVAWVYGENKAAVDYFKTVNKVDTFTVSNNINIYQNDKNNAVKFYVSKERLSASEVEKGWDKMFSETRRWRNDTYGTYQKRINYTGKNYRTFYKDKSLKVNDNHEHTWFEYVPENIKKAKEKVPLVLFFHGINCVGLYGAEQSGWSDLADRDNFIVVYPDPSIEERWNVWDDPRLPSDVSFVMALIEKMKEKYPIDEKRIYISGFSMGSMFTNALAASYPEVFAGAIPCHAPHLGYLSTLDEQINGMLMFRPDSILGKLEKSDEKESPTKVLADKKKRLMDYRMPVVQCFGFLDGVGFNNPDIWPLTKEMESTWLDTLYYWQKYNNIPLDEELFDSKYETGISSQINTYLEEDKRYLLQGWHSDDDCNLILYQFLGAKRLAHALVCKQVEIAWDHIKNFNRKNDGTLKFNNL